MAEEGNEKKQCSGIAAVNKMIYSKETKGVPAIARHIKAWGCKVDKKFLRTVTKTEGDKKKDITVWVPTIIDEGDDKGLCMFQMTDEDGSLCVIIDPDDGVNEICKAVFCELLGWRWGTPLHLQPADERMTASGRLLSSDELAKEQFIEENYKSTGKTRRRGTVHHEAIIWLPVPPRRSSPQKKKVAVDSFYKRKADLGYSPHKKAAVAKRKALSFEGDSDSDDPKVSKRSRQE